MGLSVIPGHNSATEAKRLIIFYRERKDINIRILESQKAALQNVINFSSIPDRGKW